MKAIRIFNSSISVRVIHDDDYIVAAANGIGREFVGRRLFELFKLMRAKFGRLEVEDSTPMGIFDERDTDYDSPE